MKVQPPSRPPKTETEKGVFPGGARDHFFIDFGAHFGLPWHPWGPLGLPWGPLGLLGAPVGQTFLKKGDFGNRFGLSGVPLGPLGASLGKICAKKDDFS